MTSVPESNNRQDWPRLVSQAVNRATNAIIGILTRLGLVETGVAAVEGDITALDGRVTALEAATVKGFEILAAAPGTPFEGQSYYDNVLHKARTWDGSAWQDHW